MAKNFSKIYGRAALMLLAIIISGLLNICLFSFQAKAAPVQSPKLNFAYGDGGDCLTEAMPEPTRPGKNLFNSGLIGNQSRTRHHLQPLAHRFSPDGQKNRRSNKN